MGRSLSRDRFVYLGGVICGDGNSDIEIHRRMTAGANAWRKVEGMMGDTHVWVRNNGTNRETTGESAGLRKQLDTCKKNRGSE